MAVPAIEKLRSLARRQAFHLKWMTPQRQTVREALRLRVFNTLYWPSGINENTGAENFMEKNVMKNAAKKPIFQVKPYVPGRPIEEVKREYGLKSVIKLASNENPYGPSPKVMAAIKKAALGVNRYPDGGCFILRQELAKRLKVGPDQLVFGNGSDETIVLAVKAFVQEGDEVIIAQPTFLVYEIASRLAGAAVKAVALNGFNYDLNAMRVAVTAKTRIIFLGNPDNPAGSYIPRDAWENFIRSVRKDILIFIDEAYFEFVDAPDYGDSITLIKSYKNVVVSRTFSKMYGLAGLRIGYAVADAQVADILNRVREPFNVNSLAQAAAVACLKDSAFYRRIAKESAAQREWIYGELDKLGVEYRRTFTNFVLIKTKLPAADLSKQLLRQGVIIRDMSAWGLDHYIRVSIGKPAENKRFIKILGSLSF
ncbi:MAG: histidinol-phosphate transaminase [Candidatus Omnitrophica bacterium]|nr:histidinol-phosphate transaminase [Candidatus Omnitrophota bacterium]